MHDALTTETQPRYCLIKSIDRASLLPCRLGSFRYIISYSRVSSQPVLSPWDPWDAVALSTLSRAGCMLAFFMSRRSCTFTGHGCPAVSQSSHLHFPCLTKLDLPKRASRPTICVMALLATPLTHSIVTMILYLLMMCNTHSLEMQCLRCHHAATILLSKQTQCNWIIGSRGKAAILLCCRCGSQDLAAARYKHDPLT